MSAHDQVVQQAPHPCTGWIVVAPIPDPDEGSQTGPEAEVIKGPGGMKMLGIRLGRPEAGIRSGVVLERGGVPDGLNGDLLFPFEDQATVWYSEQVPLRIGEWDYLPAQNVIAWQEAPQ